MQTSNVWKQRGAISPSSFDLSRRSPYTAEQSMFLRRLRDMIDKRRQLDGRLARSDWRFRLLDKALYSTYRDCLDLGLGEEARHLVERVAHAGDAEETDHADSVRSA